MDTASSLLSVLELTSMIVRYNIAVARSHGWVITFLTFVISPGLSSEFQRISKDLLKEGNDDALIAFRQSITDECNMMAVAVSGSYYRILKNNFIDF